MNAEGQDVVREVVVQDGARTMPAADLVEQTWAEVGCRVRPLKRWVFVRTLPVATHIGSIALPPKLASFHGELPHMKTIHALVLSVGPKATVKKGDVVCFTRLQFAWWKKLDDRCMVGWIDENDLTGYFVD